MADMILALKIVGQDAASGPIGAVGRALHGLDGSARAPVSSVRALGDSLSDVRREGGLLGGVAHTVGTAVVGLGLAAGTGLGALAVTGVRAASDVSESLNKVGVVFGSAASGIVAFADTAASKLGQSRGAALEATGTFGNLFVSMGLGQGEAAKLATGIVTLGSDLASFNNIKPDEALDKLRAGLVGETEPLRALGVNMNAAMVEAKAMELGLAATTKELTEADKVQARYALILAQTKTAQGDFANTSTGMANASRIISATLGDLQAQIGGRLLPVVAPLVSQFAIALPAALAVAGGDFSGLANLLGTDLLGAFAAFNPTVERAGHLFLAVRDALMALIPEPVGSLIAGLFGAEDAAGAGSNALQFLASVVNTVTGAIEAATRFISEHKEAQTILVGILGAAATAYALTTAVAIAHGVALGVTTLATQGLSAASALLNVVLTANPIGLLVVALGGMAAMLIYTYQTSEEFRNVVDGAFVSVRDVVTSAIGAASGAINGFVGAIRGALDAISNLISAIGRIPSRISLPEIPKLPGFAGGGSFIVPGFQHGGAFAVGGLGGVDSQLVVFRATPGEVVTVTPPGLGNALLMHAGRTINIHVTINAGSVIHERDLADTVRESLLQTGRRNVSIFGGLG